MSMEQEEGFTKSSYLKKQGQKFTPVFLI